VTIFLESAELIVKMRKDLTMRFWEENADKIITDHYLPLLHNKGSINRKLADKKVEDIYSEFEKRRKSFEAKEADRQDEEEMKMLDEAEKLVKGRE